MLLLVLILVLIAFGLLVVALLSGSVLWAWVSVGVSVAAAAVLLVDWLQRRSAVQGRRRGRRRRAHARRRAGAAAARAGPEPVVEPATEIIPASSAPDGSVATGAARASPTAGRRTGGRPRDRGDAAVCAVRLCGGTVGRSWRYRPVRADFVTERDRRRGRARGW